MAEKEGDQPVEYLLNSNGGTVTLSLLHEDFPGVTGLQFRNKANNYTRKVYCDRTVCYLHQPCEQAYTVTRKSVAEKEGGKKSKKFTSKFIFVN